MYWGGSEQYIKLGPTIEYSAVPEDLKNQYDYFVTGSDQVWRCWNGKEELDYFLLRFADDAQKLTILPSFGFDKVPPEYVQTFREGLKGFQYLSCREESGKVLIKELTGRDAVVLLDPTMLINVDEWLKILRRPINFVDGDYILIYMLRGLSGDVKDAILQLAEAKTFK